MRTKKAQRNGFKYRRKNIEHVNNSNYLKRKALSASLQTILKPTYLTGYLQALGLKRIFYQCQKGTYSPKYF